MKAKSMPDPNVALVVLSRNQEFRELQRLLSSIAKTDFPRRYCVFLVVQTEPTSNDGSIQANRREALQRLILSDFDWILYVHDDIHFTGPFWKTVLEQGSELVVSDKADRTECFVAMTRPFLRDHFVQMEEIIQHGLPEAARAPIPIAHKGVPC